MKKKRILTLPLLLTGITLLGSFQAQGMFSGAYNWLSTRVMPHVANAVDVAGFYGGMTIAISSNSLPTALLGTALAFTPAIRSLATSYFQQQQRPPAHPLMTSYTCPLDLDGDERSYILPSQTPHTTSSATPRTTVQLQIIREIEAQLTPDTDFYILKAKYYNDPRIGSIYRSDNHNIYNFFEAKSRERMLQLKQKLNVEIQIAEKSIACLQQEYRNKSEKLLVFEQLEFNRFLDRELQQYAQRQHCEQCIAWLKSFADGSATLESCPFYNSPREFENIFNDITKHNLLNTENKTKLAQRAIADIESTLYGERPILEVINKIKNNHVLNTIGRHCYSRAQREHRDLIFERGHTWAIAQQSEPTITWLHAYADGHATLESCPLYNAPREFEKQFKNIIAFDVINSDVQYAIGKRLISYAHEQLHNGKKVAEVTSEFDNLVILKALARYCLSPLQAEHLQVIYQIARKREAEQERKRISQWLISYAVGTSSLDQCPVHSSTFKSYINSGIAIDAERLSEGMDTVNSILEIIPELSPNTIDMLKQRVYADAQKILLQDTPLTSQTLRKISDHPIISTLIYELLTYEEQQQLQEMCKKGREWISAMKDHADLPREHILTIKEPRGISNINGNCYLCAGLQVLCAIFSTLAEHNSLDPVLLEKQDPENNISCALNRFISYYLHEDYERGYSHGRNDPVSINPRDFQKVFFKNYPSYFGFKRVDGDEDRGGSTDRMVTLILGTLSEKCKRYSLEAPCTLGYKYIASGTDYHDTVLSLYTPAQNTQAEMAQFFGSREERRIIKLPEILCIKPGSNNISYELDLSAWCTGSPTRARYRLLTINYSSKIHEIAFVRYCDQWFLCSDSLVENITGNDQKGMRAALAQDNIIYWDKLKTYFSFFCRWVTSLHNIGLIVYERLPETSTSASTQSTQRIPSRL